MSEEETQKPEATEENTDEGIDNKTDSIIDRTDKAAERVEAANKKTEELVKRQEELYMRHKLGGGSMGGERPKSVKEQAAELARAHMEAEGFDTLEQSKKRLNPGS